MPHLPSELERGLPVVNSRRPLENLDDGTSSIDFQHLPSPEGAIAQPDLHNLRILWLLLSA